MSLNFCERPVRYFLQPVVQSCGVQRVFLQSDPLFSMKGGFFYAFGAVMGYNDFNEQGEAEQDVTEEKYGTDL